PPITRKIESTDAELNGEQAAEGLFSGVERDDFHIMADLITHLFKGATKENAPSGNWVIDMARLVGFISCSHLFGFHVPLWCRPVD
ncbi:hypothetical protein BU15DRAFT_8267, partial [Melanogaster broomeanus]